MDRVEIRELVYFVAVAEELHFSRAAARLEIAQPALSRAIGRLERRVGVQLLERTSRQVRLTPAGDLFLAESRKVLDAADAAVATVQRVDPASQLVLALRPGGHAGLLARVLDAYDRAPGSVPVEILFTPDGAAALRDGTADLAVLCADTAEEGLESAVVTIFRPMALVPAGHRLAGRAAVTRSELVAEEIFQELPPATAMEEVIDRVALGRLIVIEAEGVLQRVGEGVVGVPVADIPDTRVWICYRPRGGGIPPAIQTFIQVAQRVVTRPEVTRPTLAVGA
jgi:DNA-binding transcriptional LysR family regulator